MDCDHFEVSWGAIKPFLDSKNVLRTSPDVPGMILEKKEKIENFMIFMIFSISDLVLKSVLLSTGNNLITKSRHRSRSASVMAVVVGGWR